MKQLKSLKEFEQEGKSLNKKQLKTVKGGYIVIRYEETCKAGCDDIDEMRNEYNPMTGRWSGWYLHKRTHLSTYCE